MIGAVGRVIHQAGRSHRHDAIENLVSFGAEADVTESVLLILTDTLNLLDEPVRGAVRKELVAWL